VGLEAADDAAVWSVAPDLALIQTLDFFPPIVDDPYAAGQIGAANALGDGCAHVAAADDADLEASHESSS